jgi:hypothetical protein
MGSAAAGGFGTEAEGFLFFLAVRLRLDGGAPGSNPARRSWRADLDALDEFGLTQQVRDLGPDDRPLLESFRCAGSRRRPWTHDAQDMITDHLADALATGEVFGMGLFDDERLVSVIAWSINKDRWNSAVLATAHGPVRRRHYAERLKTELLERVQAAAALSVTSTVHADNEPMVALNRKLGAQIVTDPERRDYLLCTVRLR